MPNSEDMLCDTKDKDMTKTNITEKDDKNEWPYYASCGQGLLAKNANECGKNVKRYKILYFLLWLIYKFA